MALRAALFGGKLMVGGAFAGSAATVGYSYYDPAVRRQLEFWQMATPAVVDYAWCSFKNRKLPIQERLAAFDHLHEKHSKTALDVILTFRGLFIKFGQVLSVRPEIVPEAYQREFKKLQSEVPSVNVQLVKQVLEEDLGAKLEDVFEEFKSEPVGAASIGQAHLAKLKATGETVVVKVQYPDVKPLFDADLQSLKLLFYLIEPEAMPAYNEISIQLAKELDFESEARNLATIHDRVMPVYHDRVSIPEVREKYCSPRVITMTYLEGEKWDSTILAQLRLIGGDVDVGEDLRDVMGKHMANLGKDLDVGEGSVPVLKPTHNSFTQWTKEDWVREAGKGLIKLLGTDGSILLYRYVMQLYNFGGDLFYYTMHHISKPIVLLAGRRVKEWVEDLERGHKIRTQLRNIVTQLDLLLDVHGFEVFTGMVNADPHPGNIIMLPDQRIGLIDYGQCKSLDIDARRKLAKVMIAISENNSDEEIAQSFRDLGVVTENNSVEFLAAFAKMSFDKIEAKYLDPNYHLRLHSLDRVREVPPELIMVSRTSALLRGLAMTLGHNKSVADVWMPRAQEFLAKHPV